MFREGTSPLIFCGDCARCVACAHDVSMLCSMCAQYKHIAWHTLMTPAHCASHMDDVSMHSVHTSHGADPLNCRDEPAHLVWTYPEMIMPGVSHLFMNVWNPLFCGIRSLVFASPVSSKLPALGFFFLRFTPPFLSHQL